MSTALREVFARFTTRFDDRALKKGERSVNGLQAGLKRLGTALVAYVGFNAVRGMITGFQEAGDELDKTSKVIGISTGALQAWRHAANLSGVDAQSFSTGLIRLQRNMYEAQRGSETAQEAFSRLGISVTGADGQLRSADEILRDMADPLSQLESSTERVALLNVLMGRSGARIGPLFAQGAEGVEAMLRSAEELGGGIGQDAIQASADLTDAQENLNFAWTSAKSDLAVVLLPALTRLTEALTKLIGDGRALKALFGTALAGAVVFLTTKFVGLGVAGAAAGLKTTLAWGAIAVGIFAAFLLVEDFITALEGGDSAIGRMAKSMEEWRQEQKDEGGFWGWVAEEWEDAIEWFEELIESVASLFGFDSAPDLNDPDAGFATQRGLVSPEEAARQRAREDGGGGDATKINIARNRLRKAGFDTENIPNILAREAASISDTEAQRYLTSPERFVPGLEKDVAPRGRIEIGQITINESEDPEQTRRIIGEELDRANREMEEALVPQ